LDRWFLGLGGHSVIAANTEKIPDRQQNARPTSAEAVGKFMTASMDP
jgi:hypothetical protein